MDFDDGDLTPEIGAGPSTYTRAATAIYPDATDDSAMTTYSSGTAAVETFPYLISSTQGGISLSTQTVNNILQSDNPATTWSIVGSAIANNGESTGPDGADNSAGQIDLTGIGDGIEQSSVSAAASNEAIASAWVRALDGTISADIVVEGDSGGTPETTLTNFTATSSWQRVSVARNFSASATGNIRMQLLSQEGDTVTLEVWGMQLEVDQGGGPTISDKPFAYAETTTTITQTDEDKLQYAASNFTGVTVAGTLCTWLNLTGSKADYIKFSYLFSMDTGLILASIVNASTLRLFYNGATVVSSTAFTWTHQEWFQLCAQWDQANDRYAVWKNGLKIREESSSQSEITAGILELGNLFNGGPGSGIQGIMSKFRVYDQFLTASQIVGLYLAQRGDYGL